MNYTSQFLKILMTHDGEQPSRTFARWAEMAYCALAKPAIVDAVRSAALEARWQRLADQVGPAGVSRAAEALALTALELERNGGRDCLGALAQDDRVQAVNHYVGQFFTPADVCALMVKMTIGDARVLMQHKPYLTIGEPAVGAGAMLLEAIRELRAQGIDPTRQVWVDAMDVSALCTHLAFIQLSLVGCAGIVRHGNTLTLEMHETATLPLSGLFLLRHGWPGAMLIRNGLADAPRDVAPCALAATPPADWSQATLW